MKKSVCMLMLFLSGCTNGNFFLLPDQQDLKFACDMNPYKQGCERKSDYDQHFKSLEGNRS